MKRSEKVTLLSLSITILVILGFYFLKFRSYQLSSDQTVWGAFGDFVGGILNPVLSFVLILLVIKEAIEARKQHQESKSQTLKSQKQIDKQIRLIMPKPEVVYYLKHQNGWVFAIVENIGNAVAHMIKLKYDYLTTAADEKDFRKNKNRLLAINYLTPNQKAGIRLGKLNLQDIPDKIPQYKVLLKFSEKREERYYDHNREFFISGDILKTIIRSEDIEGAIKEVAQVLYRNGEN